MAPTKDFNKIHSKDFASKDREEKEYKEVKKGKVDSGTMGDGPCLSRGVKRGIQSKQIEATSPNMKNKGVNQIDFGRLGHITQDSTS